MQKKRNISSLKVILGAIISLIFISDISYASSSLLEGATICMRRVLPSLFPLMVASDLISTASGGKYSAVLQPVMGWLFGFPICALGSSRLYSEGKISNATYSTLICIGGMPSIGFFLGVCGDIFGIKRALTLYATSVISAILCGLVMQAGARDKKPSLTGHSAETERTLTEVLSDSLKNGALRCISITACVSFFYMVSSCITRFTDNKELCAVLFGFFEFSGGCNACRALPMNVGYILCSGILSFSGISAFMQTAYAQGQYKITPNAKKYFAAKLFQAAVNMLISFCIIGEKKQYGITALIIVTVLLTLFSISQRVNRKTLNRA